MKRYTTERGVEIGIIPIPLLLDQMRESHEHPPAPTYTEQTASGHERQVAMVAEEMAAAKEHNPDWYAEHAEAWEAYQKERDASEAVLNEKLLNAITLKAVVVDLPHDDTWAEEQEFLGLDVPDSPLERRVHYVKTEVIGGAKDVIRLMALAAGSDVSEEVLAQAVDSFRDYLQGNVTQGLANPGGSVAGEPAVDAAPDGG